MDADAGTFFLIFSFRLVSALLVCLTNTHYRKMRPIKLPIKPPASMPSLEDSTQALDEEVEALLNPMVDAGAEGLPEEDEELSESDGTRSEAGSAVSRAETQVNFVHTVV